MSEAINFINGMINETILNLNTAMPARVVLYDSVNHTAMIQPLFMTKEVGQEPEPLSPIENVPILEQKFVLSNKTAIACKVNGAAVTIQFDNPVVAKPFFQPGDIVFVVFAQRSLDDMQGNRPVYPTSSRSHSIADAVIIGGVNFDL